MRTSISFSEGKMLITHLATRQCRSQHILVLWLKAIKFNFSGAKRKV